MRITSSQAAWVAVGLLAALTPAAQAQRRLLVGPAGDSPPPAETTPPAAQKQPAASPPARVTPPPAPPAEAAAAAGARVSIATNVPGLSIQTTVRAPDGGPAFVGEFSSAAQ